MSRKRLLILDFAGDGHHPYYLRLILDSPLGRESEIIVGAHADMFRHPEVAACADRLEAHAIDPVPGQTYMVTQGPLSALRRSYCLGRIYRQVYRRAAVRKPIDFVIVPYVDSSLFGLALSRRPFGGTPWLGITMRTMFHYPEMGISAPAPSLPALRRWVVHRVLRQRTLAALLTIDPSLAEYAARSPDPPMRKVHYLPDPANRAATPPNRQDCRRALQLPEGARAVLLYGSIQQRKGALQLLHAAADTRCSKSIHIILAGLITRPDSILKNGAADALREQGRLHVLNHLIDAQEEAQLIAAADAMWVGYIGFYNVSGVMALAGRNGLPVLASDSGVIGYLTRQHELGVLLDPESVDSIVAALNRLAAEPEFFARAGSNGAVYYAAHTPEEMQRCIDDVIRRSS